MTDAPTVPESDQEAPTPPVELMVTPSTQNEALYADAYECLGKDLVSDPQVPNEVQCAAQLNAIFKRAFGKPIGGGASTALMYEHLDTDPRFRKTDTPTPGSIIISPTGTSRFKAPHGHCGIVGNFQIMSNDSRSGLWDTYYTLDTWNAYYGRKLGFPVYFYDVV